MAGWAQVLSTAAPSTSGYDAVVVGGGVYGASVLFHLAQRGVHGALIERRHLASGPTGRSSANVRLHYLQWELAELTRRSMVFLREFRARTGGDCGLVETGFVFLLGEADAPAFAASVDRLRSRGFEIEARTPADVAELLPAGCLLDDVRLAVVEPGSGHADPVGTTTGFAHRAVELGARVLVNTPVAAIDTTGGRVRGVRLKNGDRIGADMVLIAAGPWSRELLRGAGVDLDLHAERHPIAILDAPGRARDVLPVVVADLLLDYYARPEGDSTILVGSRRRYPPVADLDGIDLTVGDAEAAALVGLAAGRLPELGALGIRGGWAGLYDCSRDRLPIVDRVPGVDGLFVVTGTSGHGFKLAPALGEEIARLMVTGAGDLLEPFRLDRPDAGYGRDLGGVA